MFAFIKPSKGFSRLDIIQMELPLDNAKDYMARFELLEYFSPLQISIISSCVEAIGIPKIISEILNSNFLKMAAIFSLSKDGRKSLKTKELFWFEHSPFHQVLHL